MGPSWQRNLVVAFVIASALAACSEAPTVPDSEPLDLQVRNSGLPGGYVWLSTAGDRSQGRWHRFGMAEFLCVTCPVPFVGLGSQYEIAVLDEACVVVDRFQTGGGQWLVEIDARTTSLVAAPPLGDWMPGDSEPVSLASVPCLPP